MIGLVVVGHGDLPRAFLAAADSVLAGGSRMRAVSLGAEDDPGGLPEEIKHAVREVDDGDGVIIMTDMMGGTPTNAALAMLNDENVEVVTGINLPMLLKIPFLKEKTVHEAAEFLVEYGRRNLAQPREMLRSIRRPKRKDE
ncbi:MAG: PTS sugar transporter subunit IIA [bacterium]|nr:PTS sugar transporter subunit IIA [bacterium]